MLTKFKHFKTALSPLISALIFLFASCRADYREIKGETWGTYFTILYSSEKCLDDSILAELRSIDEEFSLFNPNSVVSTVNDGRCDRVGSRFSEVFEMCKMVNEISEGAYDPTVGPLVNLWGFGKTEVNVSPASEQIDSALCYVGLADCEITEDGKISKKHPSTCFDFSSIAKGYGIDCIADMFERNGCADYMIEIGGEVLVKGVNAKRMPWRIQVDSPSGGFEHDALRVVELGPQREALATSGDYRNFKIFGDSVFGHSISPVTGMPVNGNILSVTIRCRSCALADALATACMATAIDSLACSVVARMNVKSLIVSRDSVGQPWILKDELGR